jgi:predicted TIM-barrel fold metal-dependent hydrolase
MGLTAQEVRQLVSHPIIDSDGHLLESTSLLTDFLADLVGGKRAKQILLEAANQVSMGNATTGRPRTGWWLTPNNARDIATAMAPGFRVERAGELGIDFSILYPSAGLVFASLPEEEARLAGVRAINNMHAELCRDYSRHLTPAALIPMHTPHEAVAELVHARSKLGMKVAMIPPIVARAVPANRAAFPQTHALDSYGADSPYDYDEVWAKFSELGVAVTSHGSITECLPFGRTSPSSYVFNHIGGHAFQQDHLCKSLVLAGVPQRFPELNFAFLESGAMWACDLLQSLVDHFHKRGPAGLALLDPSLTDRAELTRLLEPYGAGFVTGIPQSAGKKLATYDKGSAGHEFQVAGADSANDLIRAFDRFYFGCEADDRGVAVALRSEHLFHVRLKAILGSDIGHWDVPDATQVIPESYELIEHSVIQADDYEDFVFRHVVLLHGQMNPEFFAGTAVEDRASDVLRREGL